MAWQQQRRWTLIPEFSKLYQTKAAFQRKNFSIGKRKQATVYCFPNKGIIDYCSLHVCNPTDENVVSESIQVNF